MGRSMMEVKSVSKIKNRNIVIIDDQRLDLDISLIYKYRLKAGNELPTRTFNALMKDKEFFDFDQLGLRKLTKMRTVQEIRQILFEAGASETIIKQLIDKYIKHKYLDDLGYAKAYISSKKYTYGPLYLKEVLKNKGIGETELIEAFKDYKETEILQDLIAKRINKSNNRSFYRHKLTLYSQFIAKGFTPELIKSIISQSNQEQPIDESDLILKTFEVTYYKFLKISDAKTAYQKALKKLYRNGFDYQTIIDVISSRKDEYLNEDN
jgi:regulatory protein